MMPSEQTYQSINPFNLKRLASFEFFDIQQLDVFLNELYQAQKPWAFLSFKNRSSVFLELSIKLEKNRDKLAKLISAEVGKPLSQSYKEIDKSAQCCRFYASHTEELLGQIDNQNIHYKPLGNILGIMPWNYPLWQLIRFCVPVMLMGNAVIIKPAPNSAKTAYFLNDLMQEVLPFKVYQTLLFKTADLEFFLKHSYVQGVSLTGSARAGSIVASLAGRYIKKCVLELGGVDPFIVCKQADVQLAVNLAVESRLQNNGQTCIAAKRFLLHESIYEHFQNALFQKLEKIKIGDPGNLETQLGPQARLDLKNHLINQVEKSIQEGAKVVFQSALPVNCKKGFFYPPTVLSVHSDQITCMQSELFGPVFPLYSFQTDQQALSVANNTTYGLGATLMSDSEKQINYFSQHLEAGNLSINQKMSSNIDQPFGGIKNSGFGRELGLFGLLEFCNIQRQIH